MLLKSFNQHTYYVSFHKWIRLRKLMDQFLHFQTFGITLSILIT